MSGRWTDMGGGGDSSQDFTQATQEESALGESLQLVVRDRLIAYSIVVLHATITVVLYHSSISGRIVETGRLLIMVHISIVVSSCRA